MFGIDDFKLGQIIQARNVFPTGKVVEVLKKIWLCRIDNVGEELNALCTVKWKLTRMVDSHDCCVQPQNMKNVGISQGEN